MPDELDYDEARHQVQKYLTDRLENLETTGCLLAKLQDDNDLVSQDGLEIITRGSIEETGTRILTVKMVCNLTKEKCYSNHQTP